MNVKRFFGRTNKEALAKLRAELGPDAVVVRNRTVEGGVEILAMADQAPGGGLGAHAATDAHRSGAPGASDDLDAGVPEMTTVSFQQYVRDRLARKNAQAEAPHSVPPAAASQPAPLSASRSPARHDAIRSSSAAVTGVRASPAEPQADSARRIETAPAPVAARKPRQEVQGETRESIAEAVQSSVLAELQQMKHYIAEQLDTLSWFEGTRRQPVRSRLLKRLITAGFSPALARALVTRVPEEFDDAQAFAWAGRALARNLSCDSHGELLDGGGIFAMIGPTGVGKTTSTAKIAARFALKHGTQSIGLVTVDAYRIGGQDQLRSFGRMLGVPVHVAHDAASLADFLHLYMNKKLVLIDTAGIGQRDERVEELLASLSVGVVRKLLVVNAAAQPETQEEVILAYRGAQAAGMVISKLDEAVRPAGVLDCAIRHRLRLVGVADGQRVPEDWSAPNAEALIARALAVRASPAFELDDQLLGMMFSDPRGAAVGHRQANV